jgi:hypothetical protein
MVIKTNQLMVYKANFAVCSEISTKHSTQSKHDVELLDVKPGGWYVKKPIGFKRLSYVFISYFHRTILFPPLSFMHSRRFSSAGNPKKILHTFHVSPLPHKCVRLRFT